MPAHRSASASSYRAGSQSAAYCRCRSDGLVNALSIKDMSAFENPVDTVSAARAACEIGGRESEGRPIGAALLLPYSRCRRGWPWRFRSLLRAVFQKMSALRGHCRGIEAFPRRRWRTRLACLACAARIEHLYRRPRVGGAHLSAIMWQLVRLARASSSIIINVTPAYKAVRLGARDVLLAGGWKLSCADDDAFSCASCYVFLER